MRVLGIDQSLSNVGICIIEDDEIIYTTSIPTSNNLQKMLSYDSDFIKTIGEELIPEFITKEGKLTKKRKDLDEFELEMLKIPQEDRMKYIVKKIDSIIIEYVPNLVALEGISFGGSGRVIDLAKLLGRIEQKLDDLCMTYIEIPPKEVKKFAGKGNYSKEEMIEAVNENDLKVLQEKCPKNTKDNWVGLDDRVDAYWIAKKAYKALED